MRFFISIILLLCLSAAHADVVELKNGDRLNGGLVELTQKTLVWKSDTLGKVFLPVDQIANLQQFVDQQTEEQQQKLSEPVWEDSGQLRLSGRKENKDLTKEEWDFSLKTEFKKDVHRHKTVLNYENYVNDDEHSEEEYRLGYAYSWFFKPKWFMNNTLDWERNEAKNIEEQYSAGVGLGYQFWSTELHHLEAGLGISYINKNFFIKDPDQVDEYYAARWNLDWWYRPTPELKLFHDHEFLQSLKRSGDYEIETETGLRYLFTASFYGELRYEWDYDATPEVADKEQSTWVLGLGYDW